MKTKGYKQAIKNAILIWCITRDEGATYDEHVRIADSIVPDMDGACPLCEYFKGNEHKKCSFCPLGPSCQLFNNWITAEDTFEKYEAATALIDKLTEVLHSC